MSTLTQFFGGSSNSSIPAEVLVVGGGGGSGNSPLAGANPGGGGGGRVLFATLSINTGFSYTVVVGAGGTWSNQTGQAGGESSISPLFVAGGGAGAAGYTSPGVSTSILFGGSGSGGGQNSGVSTTRPGGVSPLGLQLTDTYLSIGQDGTAGGQYSSGIGGGNYPSSITGSSVNYGVGGGATYSTSYTYQNGTPGTANTGNGARGAEGAGTQGANGGSGVVIFAYPDTYAAPASITGTYTTPTRSGYRVYRFTGSGSITF